MTGVQPCECPPFLRPPAGWLHALIIPVILFDTDETRVESTELANTKETRSL